MKIRRAIVKLPLGLLCLITFAGGCKYYNEEDLTPTPPPCDTTGVTYNSTILPIFSANCLICHDSKTASGNVILDNYTDALIPAKDGRLWKAVSWEPGYPHQMPKGGDTISVCNRKQIKKWIDSGYPQ